MIKIPLPVLSLRRRAAALWHRAAGWLQFRLGAREAARRHFERVLECRGDDFSAYVHLARIAFLQCDYSCSMREFGRARRTDPARFARLALPGPLPWTGEATIADPFACERTHWAAGPLGQPTRVANGQWATGGHQEWLIGDRSGTRDPSLVADREQWNLTPMDAIADGDAIAKAKPMGESGRWGDCQDADEARRLGSLGPIRDAEITAIDWQLLLAWLQGGSRE
jgi:hypothetical protein